MFQAGFTPRNNSVMFVRFNICFKFINFGKIEESVDLFTMTFTPKFAIVHSRRLIQIAVSTYLAMSRPHVLRFAHCVSLQPVRLHVPLSRQAFNNHNAFLSVFIFMINLCERLQDLHVCTTPLSIILLQPYMQF